jgi:predicted Zn-dependent protease
LQGKHERALSEIAKGEALEPDHPIVKVMRAQILFFKGDIEDAARVLEIVINENPHLDGFRALFANVLAAKGESERAIAQLTEATLRKASADHDMSYWVASTYSILGEIDEAFEWLDHSILLGLEDWRWLSIDPSLERLRRDNRFESIKRRLSDNHS